MLYPSFAQNNYYNSKDSVAEKQKIERAIQNYKKALESNNLGMIESAILNTMNLKYHYPNYDYSSLIEPLQSLQANDKSKSVRFTSFIVKNYLLHPERYAWIDQVHNKFDKDFYVVIAEKVSEQLDK
jgi:hypothetical protein